MKFCCPDKMPHISGIPYQDTKHQHDFSCFQDGFAVPEDEDGVPPPPEEEY